MAAKFEVHRVVTREEKGLFILVGAMVEGMVQVGMNATLEGGEGGSFDAPVHSVEFVEGTGGETEPALTFHYRDPAKLGRWQAVAWEGRALRLEY
ncbi:MAG: hypothetical protein HY704_13880 [Gemmatimonadetes bacterium]|nr:hypothetical protein [Gemmatimonadota bacterium]